MVAAVVAVAAAAWVALGEWWQTRCQPARNVALVVLVARGSGRDVLHAARVLGSWAKNQRVGIAGGVCFTGSAQQSARSQVVPESSVGACWKSWPLMPTPGCGTEQAALPTPTRAAAA